MQVPKIREKEIIRLNQDEIKTLLKEAESGSGLSQKQKQFHEKTKVRDCAILALMLGIKDPCIRMCRVNSGRSGSGRKWDPYHRKGRKRVNRLHFSDEVAQYLKRYFEERTAQDLDLQQEPALFLSLRKQRIADTQC